MNSTAFFDPSYIVSGLVYIFLFLKVTLGLTVSSVCLGTFWALFCAFLEIRRVPLFKELAALYVLICRSLPNMVLLYLVYYGLPIFVMAMDQEGVFHFPVEKVTALQVAVVGLTLHTGAYLTEIFRAAYEAVPEGQKEAAKSIGMTGLQAFFRVIFPQAVTVALPMFANQFLSTMKSTSIVFVITVVELFGAAKLFSEDSMRYFEAYMAVAILYWLMGVGFEFIFGKMEVRSNRFRKGNLA